MAPEQFGRQGMACSAEDSTDVASDGFRWHDRSRNTTSFRHILNDALCAFSVAERPSQIVADKMMVQLNREREREREREGEREREREGGRERHKRRGNSTAD